MGSGFSMRSRVVPDPVAGSSAFTRGQARHRGARRSHW